MQWTAIAVTSPIQGFCPLYVEELKKRQSLGAINEKTLLVAVEDPKYSIGSGGATINALLMVTEVLSARADYTVINIDTIKDAVILVIHLGGPFLYDPCGKAFLCLGAKESDCNPLLRTNVDHIIDTMGQLQQDGRPGVWVTSTEMLLGIPENYSVNWSQIESGFGCIAVPSSVTYAQNHGVYVVNKHSSQVERLIYCEPADALINAAQANGTVPLVSGVVWICMKTVEDLLFWHASPPLDACTYIGIDSGSDPLEISLFLDVIAAAAPGTPLESFIEDCEHLPLRRAREILRSKLCNIDVHAIIIPDFCSYRDNLYWKSPLRETSNYLWSHLSHSFGTRAWKDSQVTIINSLIDCNVTIGNHSTILHSHLRSGWCVGDECYVMGIDNTVTPCQVPNDLVLMQVHLRSTASTTAWIVFGNKDTFRSAQTINEALELTFMNQKLSELFSATGLQACDLWPDESTATFSLFNANIFPIYSSTSETTLEDILWIGERGRPVKNRRTQVNAWKESTRMSIKDILSNVDVAAEFHWRDAVFMEVSSRNIQYTLLHPSPPSSLPVVEKTGSMSPYFYPAFRFFALKGNTSLFQKLEYVAISTPSLGVAARALACIADLLSAFCHGKGVLRSGPGNNTEFAAALSALDSGEREQGVLLLGKVREGWMQSPDRLIRAARHYEAAAQILIRKAVMTAFDFVKLSDIDAPEINQWVVAQSPSRVDLSGGWTDTPPITYERGGIVVNVAITVNGLKPILVACRRIHQNCIRLVLHQDTLHTLTLTSLKDLSDYTQPHASGALFKAALCCAGVVDLMSSDPLSTQLQNVLGGGIEIHSATNLPRGSGLGTSSILAGTALAAIYRARGLSIDNVGLVHATLYLEQMMTTGGGWQDQVGGICGGVKYTISNPCLPLFINVRRLSFKTGFIQRLSAHLILVFTGKTRLAKNLLQEVVRNWYARSATIVTATNALSETAKRCAERLENEDLAGLGACLNEYRAQKRTMAPSSEPTHVQRLMSLFGDHVYGQAMAGAGGGGFMYIITKKPNMHKELEEMVQCEIPDGCVKFYKAEVDDEGLKVEILKSDDDPRAFISRLVSADTIIYEK